MADLQTRIRNQTYEFEKLQKQNRSNEKDLNGKEEDLKKNITEKESKDLDLRKIQKEHRKLCKLREL